MILVICVIIAALAIANPHIHWQSYRIVLFTVLQFNTLPFLSKLRMLGYLLKDLCLSPVHCVLWLIDCLLYSRVVENTKLDRPVFIISQPRSGSTFLHRLLAEDENVFFAITYFEWKWPYICVWKLVDSLRLRNWINKRSYWSKRTKAGKLAGKMHPHLYGDHEEHGIFLEEKFYHHYFVFRRFPYPPVLRLLADFNTLEPKDRTHILRMFLTVVKKVSYYRGKGRIWITKENESISFYKALRKTFFPDAACIFLVRDCESMLPSYVMLSRESTKAKTEVDMINDTEWFEANMEFRRVECKKFYEYYRELEWEDHVLFIKYPLLVTNIFSTVYNIYRDLHLLISIHRTKHLKELTRTQSKREKGYRVEYLDLNCENSGFDAFRSLTGE